MFTPKFWFHQWGQEGREFIPQPASCLFFLFYRISQQILISLHGRVGESGGGGRDKHCHWSLFTVKAIFLLIYFILSILFVIVAYISSPLPQLEPANRSAHGCNPCWRLHFVNFSSHLDEFSAPAQYWLRGGGGGITSFFFPFSLVNTVIKWIAVWWLSVSVLLWSRRSDGL